MNSIVISIGGSVVLSEDLDKSFFKDFSSMIKDFSRFFKIFIVVGGGKIARHYISFGRSLNFDEKKLDEIGIDVTRINAKILAKILGLKQKNMPNTTDEALDIDASVVVMGGTIPGHSTDFVGAELAMKTNASKYIIATNVDGVYDKDPNKFDDAVQLKNINISDLIEEYGTDWKSAGKNIVIDGPALSIIDKANIKTFVLNGKKINEIRNVLNDKEFNGTVIKN